ncbi:MAG: (d)CMP kinase [Gammaproteobacteria bacterium]|nr:MAG: (d)CMP kinase [Gammaproteobacteria bacterium]
MTSPCSDVPVIAIDGPGGSGKGTVARAVAGRLGWHLLDSGALYRLVGIAALARNIALDDAPALAALAGSLDIRFEASGSPEGRVVLAGGDVTEEIRRETAGAAASRVAAIPAVRAALVIRQRGFRQPPGLVADGRDMGEAIFPDAALKVFLTAEVGERARRRYNQLKQKGIDVSLPALSRDMAERDRRDAQRSVAPLRVCPGARVLDSTGVSVDDVVSQVLRWAAEALPEVAHRIGPSDTGCRPE